MTLEYAPPVYPDRASQPAPGPVSRTRPFQTYVWLTRPWLSICDGRAYVLPAERSRGVNERHENGVSVTGRVVVGLAGY